MSVGGGSADDGMNAAEADDANRESASDLRLQLVAGGQFGPDGVFRSLSAAAGALVLIALVAMAWYVLSQAIPAFRQYGPLTFLTTRWAPSEAAEGLTSPNPYGIVQFIYGTVITSALAMLVAVPVSIGVSLFITEICPRRLRGSLVTITELLAAVPSVVYGFWGIFVLVPALRPVANFLASTIGQVPIIGQFFAGPFFGFSILAAAVVLSIMILPIITSVSREVFATVPKDHKEAAVALGATRWEMMRIAVLPYSKNGVVGASFLGLGRAFGETIAVTMVIGNSVIGINRSILSQGATLASVIANEFTEANQPYQLSSLFVAAFALLVITLVTNAGARFVVGRTGARRGRR